MQHPVVPHYLNSNMPTVLLLYYTCRLDNWVIMQTWTVIHGFRERLQLRYVEEMGKTQQLQLIVRKHDRKRKRGREMGCNRAPSVSTVLLSILLIMGLYGSQEEKGGGMHSLSYPVPHFHFVPGPLNLLCLCWIHMLSNTHTLNSEHSCGGDMH